jgi:hypothetical protein
VVLGYKFELVAPDIDDYAAALAKVASDTFTAFVSANPSPGTAFAEEELVALQAALDAAIGPPLEMYKTQVRSRAKLAASAAYTLNWQDGARDEAAFKLAASKGGFGSKAYPIGLGAESGWTLVRQEAAPGQSYIARVGGSVDIALLENLRATSELSVNHNYGAGFSGIRGVLDASRRTEADFAQQVGVNVGGNVVNFSVRILHLGTGDPDMTLLTEFGFKFVSEAVQLALKRAGLN